MLYVLHKQCAIMVRCSVVLEGKNAVDKFQSNIRRGVAMHAMKIADP